MRILQLVTRRQLRGAEVFAAQLSESLSERGHRVLLAGLYPVGDPPLEAPGAETADLDGSSWGLLSPSLLAAVARQLRSFRPDVVQANGGDTLKYAVASRALTTGTRAPLVYRSISIPSSWSRGGLHHRWTRFLLHRADRIAAVSTACRRDLLESFGVPADRVETIPLGTPLPEEESGDARERLAAVQGSTEDRSRSDPLLIHVGSFTPEKDHETLVKGFGRLLESIPHARLILVGDGPLRPEVENRVRRARLERSVSFLGQRSDAPRLVAGADLLLLPSRIEGLPGVVLEAAARGVPVVATDVGSLREAVEAGETGLLVPAGDPEALAGAAVDLLEDPMRMRAMGEAARRLARERFDLPRIVDRFERLYEGLLAGAGDLATGKAGAP